MRQIDEDAERCPYCGFSKNDLVPLNVLPLKTVLNNRYIIGKSLKIDGEGITYIAFDGKSSCAVAVREYMPQQLAQRDFDEITPKPGCEAKYKALLSDFWDLYTHLSDLKVLGNIRRVQEVFRENNTIYAVCEYFPFQTLNQYIIDNIGQLDWEETESLFKPLLESIAVIHQNGIIHRGISPETIAVMPDKSLKLTGFSICSARTAHSEISAELFEGYAAPEQYQKMNPHGEWTDVYAVCAVLYKVLTGTMPPISSGRGMNDNLIPVSELNDSVPEKVSKAIMEGMAYDYQERIPSVQLLMNKLFRSHFDTATNVIMSFSGSNGQPEDYEEEEEEFDMDSSDDSGRKKQRKDKNTSKKSGGKSSQGKKSQGKKSLPIWSWVLIICIPIVIGVAVLLYGLMIGFGGDKHRGGGESSLSSQEESAQTESDESSEESAESSEENSDKHEMDQFIGQSYESIISNTKYKLLYTFKDPVYEYNDKYPVGTVFAQSIDAGELVEEGVSVTLSVSKGSQYVEIPSWEGYRAKDYAQMLINDYNIPAEIQTEETSDVLEGYVCRVEPNSGERYDYASGKKVIVYSAVNPVNVSGT